MLSAVCLCVCQQDYGKKKKKKKRSELIFLSPNLVEEFFLDSPELTSVLLWMFSFDSTCLGQLCVEVLKTCRATKKKKYILLESIILNAMCDCFCFFLVMPVSPGPEALVGVFVHLDSGSLGYWRTAGRRAET